MKDLIDLNIDSKYQNNPAVRKESGYFENLLNEIRKKKIPNLDVDYLNTLITELNECKGSDKDFKTLIRKNKNLIFKTLEKDYSLTPKNHYRNKWMGIGMLIYGVTFGLIFSSILGNYAFVGIGLPIGMVLGMAIGANKDKKAKEEGLQLNINRG